MADAKEESTKEVKSRVTVVERVYHQLPYKEAHQVEARFSRNLESKKRHHTEYLEATEEWQPLPCGHLQDDVGMLVLHNDAETTPGVIPSPEDLDELAKRVIEVSYACPSDSYNCWLVPPGESMRGMPSHATQLFYRCQHGTAEATLTLIPK